MKKIHILIFIILLFIFIITWIEIFNVMLITSYTGFPWNLTNEEIQKMMIIWIVKRNIFIFILISWLVVMINKFISKKYKNNK